MSILSNRVLTMAESETLAMTRIARELRDSGKDVISLSIGEPDFETPEEIKEAGKVAIDENWSHYSPVSGYPDLRKAISQKFKRDNGLDYAPEQIVVSTGAKQSIYQVVQALVNPGDEVIIPTPYWVSYKEIVHLADGKNVFIPTTLENNFKVTADQLRAHITPKTKLIMFSSPSNPTGMLYSREELRAIADVLVEHPHVHVMADEIYEHINFMGKHESLAQFPEIKDQVITVNGVAKGYAMTGWRIGFIGATKEIANACQKLQGQITSGTNSIAQRATITAMELSENLQKDIAAMRETFRERRDLVFKLLQEIPGFETRLPEGAFYFFPVVKSLYGKHAPKDSLYAKTYNKTVIENSTDMCMYLLYDANVALVQGVAFGDDNCIRLSYAANETQLIEACRRIKEGIEKLS
ncbi:MAG TPA: pyridoxal phosphate-dependent aminotransferase [Bacteroidales bacterium]|nr:pyridoxal phosphate-dependent aminotransferase [Bacteroidales bacterium]